MIPWRGGEAPRGLWLAVSAVTMLVVTITSFAWTDKVDVSDSIAADAVSRARAKAGGRDGFGGDRRAQSALRNAYVAEKTIFTESARWADIISDFDANGTPDLVEVAPTLSYQYGMVPNQTDVVFVATIGGTLYLSARSPAGRCFYLLGDTSGRTHYATDDSCGDVAKQAWSATSW